MPIPNATRLGPYEIVSPIGAGGMGEVYRARDTRLNRTVAIKVLPEALAAQPEFQQRFQREARAISSLNHPHICALFDVGYQDGIHYLVMEYLEGETLSDRLRKGPLPFESLTKYAVEIAGALDQAHQKGFTHRDLKPGNIMLTKSGVKLLDFGLATLQRRKPTEGEATLTDPLTAKGAILGTVQYMSPEQLQGKDIDRRSDIFSFGLVLYEMATGKKAFPGDSQASIIASILEKEPAPITTLAPAHPQALDWLVKVCLRKEPEERWQSAHDVCLQLQRLGEASQQEEAPVPTARARKWTWLALAALCVALPFAAIHWLETPREEVSYRFEIFPPPNTTFSPGTSTIPMNQFALSPDGRTLAFAAKTNNVSWLWIRRLDETDARQVPGTDGAIMPFWSPDSQWLGFVAGNELRKVDLRGGPAQRLADASPDPRGASWGRQDVIAFAPNNRSGIHTISTFEGDAKPVIIIPAKPGVPVFWPRFLPNGRDFLFFSRHANPAAGGTMVSGITGMAPRRIRASDWEADFAEPGFLLFIEGGSLMAQTFDAGKLEVKGEPFVVARHVAGASSGQSNFSISRNGVLAYASSITQNGRPALLDRTGVVKGFLGSPGDYVDLRFSPDGNRIAFGKVDPIYNTPDIWVHEIGRGTLSRLTADRFIEASPLWSPDGSQLIFRGNARGLIQVLRKPASMMGGEVEALSPSQVAAHAGGFNYIPTNWASDGNYLIVGLSGVTGFDIWAFSIKDQKTAFPVANGRFNELNGNLSPDRRWLAYSSDETGRHEIYVQDFPRANEKMQISNSGGVEPRWRGDGKDLYYLSPDGKLMVVSVKSGDRFSAEAPAALFPVRVSRDINPFRTNYAVSPDGQSFVVNTLTEEPRPTPIVVVTNWLKAVRR
ncbi:MAG: serine/threonine-protein kinase [Acidobacteriia bacterium]|nr:serine/threonine-protein kinase [Terriglobia bacterium]